IEDASVHIPTEIQEQKDLNKIMYVNSPEGLRVRNLPSINGDRIGLLDYLTEVKIKKEDNDIVSIEGIEGKWVNIITPIEGWIFNGFLENEEQYKNRFNKTIQEKIIGSWRVLKDESEINEPSYSYPSEYLTFPMLTFRRNGIFSFGIAGKGGGLGGEWKVENGIIIIMGKWGSEGETEEESKNAPYETIYLTDIKFLNDDNVTLYNGMYNEFQILKIFER
ncbi:MAG: SH3 domain-containing protein, partial [Treponema sp.]|nr:SH3 domain-containing protein [Treponema sp.]